MSVKGDQKVHETVTHLLLRSKVVDNVEEFSDLFRSFSFNHVRDGFTADITAWRS